MTFDITDPIFTDENAAREHPFADIRRHVRQGGNGEAADGGLGLAGHEDLRLGPGGGRRVGMIAGLLATGSGIFTENHANRIEVNLE